jgi:hypothetical protein
MAGKKTTPREWGLNYMVASGRIEFRGVEMVKLGCCLSAIGKCCG